MNPFIPFINPSFLIHSSMIRSVKNNHILIIYLKNNKKTTTIYNVIWSSLSNKMENLLTCVWSWLLFSSCMVALVWKKHLIGGVFFDTTELWIIKEFCFNHPLLGRRGQVKWCTWWIFLIASWGIVFISDWFSELSCMLFGVWKLLGVGLSHAVNCTLYCMYKGHRLLPLW